MKALPLDVARNFILSLSVSLNCLGAFLPRPFHSPWGSSFQAWGLRKGSHEGWGVFLLVPYKCPWCETHLSSHMCHSMSRSRNLSLGPPSLAFKGLPLPSSSPPPSQLPFTSPRPTATSRLRAPGGSCRNFFLFNARQATCCSQMSGKAQ